MQEKDKAFSFLYSCLYSFVGSEAYDFPFYQCVALSPTVDIGTSLLGQPLT